MKKNWTMRVGALMLALTLITSCFVGGTFAKYVAAGEGSDSARVAKFGVEITGADTMFATTYETHETAAIAEIGSNSVISSNADKVVAPGTNGALADVSITGTPEVAVRVENTVKTMTLEGWTLKDGTFYCPLVFTIGTDDNVTVIDGKGYDNADELIAEVTATVEAFVAEYAANTDLSDIADAGFAMTWAWPFETGRDVDDTYLGDLAAAGNASKVTIEIATTVTQID